MAKAKVPRQRGPYNRPVIERFMALVSPEPNSGCWLWTGSCVKNRNGEDYPLFNLGRTRRAHRVSYELFKEPLPDGLHIRHKCDVPTCVNPDHLLAGTKLDNADDCIIHGKDFVRGANHTSAKLSRKTVGLIKARLLSGDKQADIARDYGVAAQQISRINIGKAWLTREDARARVAKRQSGYTPPPQLSHAERARRLHTGAKRGPETIAKMKAAWVVRRARGKP